MLTLVLDEETRFDDLIGSPTQPGIIYRAFAEGHPLKVNNAKKNLELFKDLKALERVQFIYLQGFGETHQNPAFEVL